MNSMKLNEVQLTALIPLWGRAKYSSDNPELLKDNCSIEVLKKISEEHEYVGENFDEYGGLCYLVRGRKLDNEVLSFSENRKKAIIVNLGCGLDTGFERVGKEKNIMWYNLDLEDMIDFRKSIIECDDTRHKLIGKSILDYTWIEEIDYQNSSDVLFLAGGLFHFFHKEDITKLLEAIAHKVPGSTIVFDINSKEGTRLSNEMFKKLNKNAMMYFYVDGSEDLNDISKYVESINISDFWSEIEIKDSWLIKTKETIKLCSEKEFAKFIKIKFKSSID